MLSSLPILLVSVVLAFTSCTKSHAPKPATPEGVVKEFVQLSAGSKGAQDRKRLSHLCTGKMREAFEGMSDELFRIIYLDSGLTVHDLQFVEVKNEGDLSTVRYRVEVTNPMGTDATREVNEREVQLERANGEWSIRSISVKGSDRLSFTRGMIF